MPPVGAPPEGPQAVIRLVAVVLYVAVVSVLVLAVVLAGTPN